VDNFDRGIKKDGRILNDILDDIEDSARDVGIIKPDDSYEVTQLEVDDQGPVNGRGEHAVAIVVGPTSRTSRKRRKISSTSSPASRRSSAASAIWW
jgi:hypothetical protein